MVARIRDFRRQTCGSAGIRITLKLSFFFNENNVDRMFFEV
jgi:hypothetical protein